MKHILGQHVIYDCCIFILFLGGGGQKGHILPRVEAQFCQDEWAQELTSAHNAMVIANGGGALCVLFWPPNS